MILRIDWLFTESRTPQTVTPRAEKSLKADWKAAACFVDAENDTTAGLPLSPHFFRGSDGNLTSFELVTSKFGLVQMTVQVVRRPPQQRRERIDLEKKSTLDILYRRPIIPSSCTLLWTSKMILTMKTVGDMKLVLSSSFWYRGCVELLPEEQLCFKRGRRNRWGVFLTLFDCDSFWTGSFQVC